MKGRNVKRIETQPAGFSRCGSGRRGNLTVEFALVIPIVFLLFFGAIELTTMNIIRHTASNAAYEAARKAALPGTDIAAAEAEATRLLDVMGLGQGVSVDVEVTSEFSEVTVSVPMAGNSWGLTRLSGGLTIEKSCRLTREEAF